MQVIIFDKFFKCLYHLKNIPNNWHFDKIHQLLELTHKPNEYQAIRLADYSELCTDYYTYKDGNLILTGSNYE